jgi:hypothetical protein
MKHTLPQFESKKQALGDMRLPNGVSMRDFKAQLCAEHLVPIQDYIRKLWPHEDPGITLLIRTPWLDDGGILITNDSIPDAQAEFSRLSRKEGF